MTDEIMRIRDEILSSPTGEVDPNRALIDDRLQFAQQLATWETLNPQIVRAEE
jgi:hypothetical protein